jgi:hypothetical protein
MFLSMPDAPKPGVLGSSNPAANWRSRIADLMLSMDGVTPAVRIALLSVLVVLVSMPWASP